MKIYFAGAIRAGRENQESYFVIVSELSKYGNVLTSHVADKNLTDQGEKGITDQYIFERDEAWIRECDLLVAEVTTPSLGVGYEIGHAESIGKPVVCLYRETEGKKLSGMISGNFNIKVYNYDNPEEVKSIFEKYFNHTS